MGSSGKSQHAKGQAADFEINGLSNKELATWVYKNCDFDQIILEFHDPEGDPNSGWVHCSYRNDGSNRHNGLIINQKTKASICHGNRKSIILENILTVFIFNRCFSI